MDNSPRQRTPDPTYLDCHNKRDMISLDDFDEKSDIVYVWDGMRWHCYDRANLLRFLEEPNARMARWIGPSNPMLGSGGPSLRFEDVFYRMPDGYYVSFDSFYFLNDATYKYYEKIQRESNVPLGNIQGNYTISSLHGQESYNVYDLVPREDDDFDEDDIKGDEVSSGAEDYVSNFLNASDIPILRSLLQNRTPPVLQTPEQRVVFMRMESYANEFIAQWLFQFNVPVQDAERYITLLRDEFHASVLHLLENM